MYALTHFNLSSARLIKISTIHNETVLSYCQQSVTILFLLYFVDEVECLKEGKYSIVMLSPEALFTQKWRKVFQLSLYRKRVKVIAVDEAHCVVQW